jgi:hypothetical protein
MIAEDVNKVEKDLTMICNNVPINDRTVLDMLCHDNNGQLVIVQLSVNEDDLMLLQAIQSLDYVNKFKSFLKATYSKHKIDEKENPRLILIAPGFSDALRLAVENMKGIRIDLFEWEYLKLGDYKGLRLQPLFGPTPTERPREREEKPAEKKRESKTKKKEIEPEPEMKEELEPEPLIPEMPKEISEFPQQEEEQKEETEPASHKEEQPKRKLRLF